jgi:PAS domain S-box-containing protein
MTPEPSGAHFLLAVGSTLAGGAGLAGVLIPKPFKITASSGIAAAGCAALVGSGVMGFSGPSTLSGGLAAVGVVGAVAGAVLAALDARKKERYAQTLAAEAESRRREIDRLGTSASKTEAELIAVRTKLSAREKSDAAADAQRSAQESASARSIAALEAAQASEKRHRAAFDAAHEGIVTLDPKTYRVLSANPAMLRMTGLSAEDIAKKTLIDLCAAAPAKPSMDDIERASRGHNFLSVEIERDGGGSTPAEVSLSSVGEGAEALVVAIARRDAERRALERDALRHIEDHSNTQRRLEQTAREATEKCKRAEDDAAKLRTTQARKDYLVATVSHELRTPLTSIGSFSEILMNGQDVEPAVQKEFLDIIHRESVRLTRLVCDVLDLARIESGEERLALSDFDLRDVIADAVASVSGVAIERGVNVRVTAPTSPRLVHGDRDKVQQLAINLIANAVKFSPEEGEIQVIVSDPEGHGRVQMSVADTGPGIAQEELEAVFEKFRRSADSPPSNLPGSGLGLAICREIASLHGGRVWAESEPGKGAAFRVDLPLSAEGKLHFAERASRLAGGGAAATPVAGRPVASSPAPAKAAAAGLAPRPARRAPDPNLTTSRIPRLTPVGRGSDTPKRRATDRGDQQLDELRALAALEGAGEGSVEWSTTGSLPPLRSSMMKRKPDGSPQTGDLPPIR